MARARGARAVHVYPVGDLRRHVLCGPCWCKPKATLEGAPLVVHYSADGRELVETHGLQ